MLQIFIIERGYMRPKVSENEELQLELGKALLSSFLNMKDELVLLGNAINWKHLCESFGKSFNVSQGRPGLPTIRRASRASVR